MKGLGCVPTAAFHRKVTKHVLPELFFGGYGRAVGEESGSKESLTASGFTGDSWTDSLPGAVMRSMLWPSRFASTLAIALRSPGPSHECVDTQSRPEELGFQSPCRNAQGLGGFLNGEAFQYTQSEGLA
jgi:hypothetical protein